MVDGAHIGVNKFAWIEQYRQMYQELQRQMDQYRTQIRELEQKYVRGPSFNGSIGYREELSERGLNDYVTERMYGVLERVCVEDSPKILRLRARVCIETIGALLPLAVRSRGRDRTLATREIVTVLMRYLTPTLKQQGVA